MKTVMPGRRIAAVLAALLVPALFPPAAAALNSAARSLPAEYAAGQAVAVSVQFWADPVNPPAGLVLTEKLPAGWVIESSGDYLGADRHVYKAARSAAEGREVYQWLYFSNDGLNSFTLAYTARAPAGAAGTAVFAGDINPGGETGGDKTMAGPDNGGEEVTVSLRVGWNLVALPLDPAAPLNAAGLLAKIDAAGGAADQVFRWDTSDGWVGHVGGLPFNNFDLVPGAGYFVRVTATPAGGASPAVVAFAGSPVPGVTLGLAVGWNLVGLPGEPWTASALLEQVAAAGGAAEQVFRWDTSDGWVGHVGGLPFNNFTTNRKEGYFIRVGTAAAGVPF